MDKILEDFTNEMIFIKEFIGLQEESHANYFKIASKKQPVNIPIAKIKQFSFSSYIISIYGAYEHYIEQILSQYLKELCKNVSLFSNLPESIQKNNLDKTMDILKKLEYPKYKHLKRNDLIKILHQNMNEDIPFLNIEAFKNHAANFRIKVVEAYFGSIGVEHISQNIRNYTPLKEYLSEQHTDYITLKNSIIFSKIDEICEIRNNIAHGVKSVQLLGPSIINEHIDFFISFAKALFHLLQNNIHEFIFLQNNTNVFTPIKLFKKNIIGFNTGGAKLNKTKKVLVKRSKGHYPEYLYLDILEIQHNGNSIETIESDNPTIVTINVSHEIGANNNFILIDPVWQY